MCNKSTYGRRIGVCLRNAPSRSRCHLVHDGGTGALSKISSAQRPRSDHRPVHTLQNIVVDHSNCGISRDQPYTWGIEWDLCASTYLKEESRLEASFLVIS